MEACIILVATLAAYTAGWLTRVVGMTLGLVAVQAVNLLRSNTLLYMAQWSMPLFEFAHLYLWQALIMLDVVVVACVDALGHSRALPGRSRTCRHVNILTWIEIEYTDFWLRMH